MDMTSDPMPVALTASAPHPDLADQLDLHGQLVGIWEVDNRYPRGTYAFPPAFSRYGRCR
jgi:hypothetical protein